MVEPDAAFVSCPMSNLVVNGNRSTDRYHPPLRHAGYAAHGVRRGARSGRARSTPARRVADPGHRHGTLPYDKLVLSPGVEMIWDDVAGLREASRDGRRAAGLEGRPRDGRAAPPARGHARRVGSTRSPCPEAPYRCPPGPYERASLIANYFQAHKPRAKVLILDANEDVTSKGPLFKKVWAETYKGMIEYRPHCTRRSAVDAATRTREVRDPGRRARRRAQRPAADAGRRDRDCRPAWPTPTGAGAQVNWRNLESTAVRATSM